MEILRQRFARGAIDSVTFERMRQQLGASGSSDTRELEKPRAWLGKDRLKKALGSDQRLSSSFTSRTPPLWLQRQRMASLHRTGA